MESSTRSPHFSGCVEFAQNLIRTPSLPGQEGDVARLVREEMRRLRYHNVSVDEVGNVMGMIQGEGRAAPILFNAHLDHVDAGDVARWPFPPFEARIHEDRIWGRGAVDIKGPLAAQVYGAGSLRRAGIRPPGDVYVSAVVQEEIGGLGARWLAQSLPASLIVVGEPSRNELRRGHRGRAEIVLRVRGRSVHASIPDAGVNPLAVVARFIVALESLELPEDPELGSATVAPTLVGTDQSSANVIPGEARLTCDWRSLPGETSAKMQALLQRIAEGCRIPGAEAAVEAPAQERISYTGRSQLVSAHHPAFLLSAEDPALRAAGEILERAIGLKAPAGIWSFATDGGHFAAAGGTVIGFGPGDDRLAHTVRESIEISDLETAVIGNRALALELAAQLGRLASS